MADHDINFIELNWQFMTPMEKALWTTTLALHSKDDDAGLAAADAAVLRLRAIAEIRSRRPEPEDEAARAAINMEFGDFVVWYPLEYRIRHRFDRDYKELTPPSIREAYERYARSRVDFY
jgi:hypothetical protein